MGELETEKLYCPTRSEGLFPSLLGPQENGRNETSYRPFYFEYLPCGPPFQNEDQQVHQGFYTLRNLVDIARFNWNNFGEDQRSYG
jgi:hypothetical protein